MKSRIAALAFTAVTLIGLLSNTTSQAVQNVGSTRHNLSTSNAIPGAIKSTTVTQICVFCHTPHAAMPDAPLWNHTLSSGQTYTPYGSSTLNASPGQPTGKSTLCLACHDGTVALGALANPPTGETLDAILTSPINPAERGYLGTDLSDDHPISFVYDSTLKTNDGELFDPLSIGLPLDGVSSDRVECTTCHDPHEATNQPFLRITSLNGAICTECHNKTGWIGSSHEQSINTWNNTGTNPWADRRAEWRGTTVKENACMNCHTPHSAADTARLPKYLEENTCFACHNGNTATTDIQAEFAKTDSHPVAITPNIDHDFTATEDPLLNMNIHAECPDCHNPHKVQADVPMVSFNPSDPFNTTIHTTPPVANKLIQDVPGIDINGGVVSTVTNQYELCFKCHGAPSKGPCGSVSTDRCSTATGWSMIRLDGIYNLRDKVNENNVSLVSWHPIVTNNPANDSEVPSLRTDIPLDKVSTNPNNLIYCTDCHNGDTSAAAGLTGPNGPHGSNNEGLLALPYALDPIVPASGSTDFVLCFKCHSEAALLVTPLSGFSHQRHINTRTKSCVNCHDPHGSHSYNHLINFQTNSTYTGGPYVIDPAGANTQPVFQDNGTYTGSCTLNCHGNAHNGRSY